MDWLLYRVISDEQRKKISNMVSHEMKEKIKHVLHYGAQREKQLRIKRLKNHLYTLGFEEQALSDFKQMLHLEKKQYMKRMIAWELMLWYANKYTEEDAGEALKYAEIAREGERNNQQLRQLAIVEAECYFHLHQKDKSLAVLQEVMDKQEHPDLYLAMANLEGNHFDKITWLNKAYKLFDLSPVTFATEDEPTYNDLDVAEKSKKIKSDVKVSVILPAYNAEEGIHVAIESILGQTWTNLELIVVDDCSTDGTTDVVKKYAELDSRVSLLSTETNSGPYIARNIGLQVSSGKYVTINDADDWSHEQKIEIQITHLENNPEVIANTSGHARLTEENLQFYRRGTPGKFIFPNMSSIMFRKKEVIEKLGYWNCVRFAADGEFKRRLVKVFGAKRYVDLTSGPLSLPRQSVTSLTGSSAFGYNGFFMGVRKEYVESLEYFHRIKNQMYYPFPVEGNIFPVPRPMWPVKLQGTRGIDEVIVGDFRLLKGVEDKVWKQVEQKLRYSRKRIGLVQVYKYDIDADIEIHDEVRKWVDGEKNQMLVYGEKVEAKQVIVIDEDVFEHKQKYIPHIICNDLMVVKRNATIDMQKQIETTFRAKPIYIPENNSVREHLHASEQIAKENWVSESEC